VMGWEADAALLKSTGATVKRLGGCCGLAGNLGVEKGHYQGSVQVAEQQLLPALRDAEPDDILLADGFSCRTQLDDLAGVPSRHLAELLAAALPERDTVMYLAGIDGDDLTGGRFHHATAGKRFLCAAFDDADTELIMHMAWERTIAIRHYGDDTGHAGFRHQEPALGHESAHSSDRSATLSQDVPMRQTLPLKDAYG